MAPGTSCTLGTFLFPTWHILAPWCHMLVDTLTLKGGLINSKEEGAFHNLYSFKGQRLVRWLCRPGHVLLEGRGCPQFATP